MDKVMRIILSSVSLLTLAACVSAPAANAPAAQVAVAAPTPATPAPAPPSSLAASLPSLMRAFAVSERAARARFDWQDMDGVLAKLGEEVAEFREALQEHVGKGAELGLRVEELDQEVRGFGLCGSRSWTKR